MIRSLKRSGAIYGAVAANYIKIMTAYSVWFWLDLAGQLVLMTIFVFFWRGVYANSASISGMSLDQMLSYVLFAQMIAPMIRWSLIMDVGGLVGRGEIAVELLRPVDLQARFYVQGITGMALSVLRTSVPLALCAWLLFGLKFPTGPAVWVAFLVTLVLGYAVLFFFDWTFASLAFYTTEVWGLHILREGVSTFFSGALIPLNMLPGWLAAVAGALPFGQALYAPIGLLSGIIPLSQAPRVWLGQVVWLVSLAAISRMTFSVAGRKVTVQGG